MRRFTTVLVLSGMLLALVAGTITPPGRTQQSETTGVLATYQMSLPASARIGSTAERRNAYESLSPSEKEATADEFRSWVEPEVNQAQSDKDNQSSAAMYVDESSMGPTLQRGSTTDSSVESTVNFSSEVIINDPPPPPGDDHPIYYGPSQGASPGDESRAANAPVANRPVDPIDPCYECEPSNMLPTVTASATPTSGAAPLNVNLSADASDPDGYIVSYRWTFGDGQTSTAAAPSHVYQNPGTYTARVTVRDDANAPASSSVTITVTSVGPTPTPTPTPVPTGDDDGDGLPETFENQLADNFTPYYFVSGGERAGTGFATFNNSVPQTVKQVFPATPPISHFRVKPIGIATANNGQRIGYMQVDYLTLWNRDDGLPVGFTCAFGINTLGRLVGFNGDVIFGSLGAHALDNERSAVLLGAPVVNGTYNLDPNAYTSRDYWTAAHEGTLSDRSRYAAPSQPMPAPAHVILALSRSKHATYTFNPDGLPLTPIHIIFATYSTLDFLYYAGYISYYKYLAFLHLADQVFFDCIIEDFQNQGGQFAGTRINVGEPNRPLNMSNFIQDSTGLLPKLNRALWIVR